MPGDQHRALAGHLVGHRDRLLGPAVFADQRDAARADVCATAAFDAVKQVQIARAPGPEQRAFVRLPLVVLVGVAGTVVGNYTLLEVIGQGGLGVVWSAHDPNLDRSLAIKVLKKSNAAPQLRLRLLREARAMARLKHPNVLTVYEVGTEGDRDFIAMELVEGGSIDEWLARSPGRDDVLTAIVAAGRESIRDRVAFVMSFGGHGDLARAMHYLTSGEVLGNLEAAKRSSAVAGADHVGVHPPHDYGLAVALLNLADRVVPADQVAPLSRGIDGFLLASSLAVTDPPKAIPIFEEMKKYQETLPEPWLPRRHALQILT